MLGQNGRLSGVLVSDRRVLARLSVCRVSPGAAEMPDGHGLRSARGDQGVGEAPTAGAHARWSAAPGGAGCRPGPPNTPVRFLRSRRTPPRAKSVSGPLHHWAPQPRRCCSRPAFASRVLGLRLADDRRVVAKLSDPAPRLDGATFVQNSPRRVNLIALPISSANTCLSNARSS